MSLELLDDGRKRILAPLSDQDVRRLTAGDVVLVSGTIYAARDAAHKRLVEMLDAGQELPFDPSGQIVYYVGPTPERPGKAIGSAGPTTASRMDGYTPRLLEIGLKGIIGKGGRGPIVREALRRHTAVYLAALGGGGALAALRISSQRVIAFPELGPEAIREMRVEGFPVWVVNDAEGRDFYSQTIRPWRRNELLPESLRLPTNV
ncbi:MAG TPA: FumA C-terminus/TtdB family hydratase beta subunit [Actinomycetota bacterium]|nr:FumA C-terminus/TtdB family hydratase beta subunit [Actinomycetota bacterium]